MSANALRKAQQTWVEASNERLGLGIVVSDPARAKIQLYNARKQMVAQGHTYLKNFTIRTSPDEPACHLWIIRLPDNDDATPDASNP